MLSAYFVKQALRPLGPGARAVGLRPRQVPIALAWSAAFNAMAWCGATRALLTRA